jgi:glycosyltransferase involved in cell wall biosynthesis
VQLDVHKMKLVIDAFNIALTQGTGVATYGRTLARAAGALGHEVNVLFGGDAGHSKDDLLNEIALAEGPKPSKRLGWGDKASIGLCAATGLLGARHARPVPLSGQVIFPAPLQLGAARFWNVRNVYAGANVAFRATGRFTDVSMPGSDVAHWTYPLPVRMPGARNIYTLHDLVPLRLPYTTGDIKRSYYAMCKRIAREADHILTVSECSRRDIVDILGVEESRVTNLYQSSDIAQLMHSVDEVEVARHVESLLGTDLNGYYLFFGAIEPKKNVSRILEAYLASGVKSPLVIVGGASWGSDNDVKLLKSMTALDAGKRIIWLGYLPRDMLARLIAGARAVLFPSLYEGFGLPVLEAMSLGTPVITSDGSSLVEVGGDAALYVNPYDVQSISRALRTLDSDGDLRRELARKGRSQSCRFSPESYGERLSSFYGALA